ncbi:restriction endonuclease fold toxin-2 domain-containing protein [Kitasatospora indigofera]|uniref:restriction endonuclease fold toxin-2 domain-containing protein n=1 Tax=Kitasatospora indigofera TaxID=67307 RepID=UPI00368FEFB7
MSGFKVVPSQMLVSSAGFSDLQNWASQIHRGLVGSLDDAGGMAGDDDTGHAFAKKYDPAAKAYVAALGRTVAQLGGTANGLYTMALNYIRTEADVAASFMQPQQLPAAADPECEQETKNVQIPTAVGHTNWFVRDIIAEFWPQGDPAKLRQAAKDWKRVGELVSRLGAEGDRLALEVTASSSSQAVDSFLANWRAVHDGCVTSGPVLNTLVSTAHQMSLACDAYADGIEDLRDTLENLALLAGGVAVVGVALTVFTLGISDAAAAGGEVAIAAEAGAAALALTAEIEASAEIAVLAEAASVIDAAAARLIPVAIAAVPAVALAAVPTMAEAAPAPTPSTPPAITPGLPPLPHDPASPFPILPPAQQQDVRTWMTQMDTDGRTKTALGPMGKPKIDARRAYQVRVAGTTEYNLYTTVPGNDGQLGMNADGVRYQDGAAVDAKYVGQQPSCKSPLRLGNVDNVPDFVYESTEKSQVAEMTKYASAFQDPRNKVNHLEIITNDDKAAAYYQAMMAAQGVSGRTRVVK